MKRNELDLQTLHKLSSEEYLKYILDYDAQNLDNKIENQLLMELVSKYVSLSQELEDKVEVIEKLSITDPLTQVNNRLKFNQSLEYELQRFKRYHESFSILLFDIDFFKRVNDNYGHDVGDLTLIHFASIISKMLRQNDIFARWGGEEFIALLVKSDLQNTITLGNRIRKAIETTLFEKVEHITVSIGVSCVQDRDTSQTIIKRADDGLYIAKEKGRNQIYSIE